MRSELHHRNERIEDVREISIEQRRLFVVPEFSDKNESTCLYL